MSEHHAQIHWELSSESFAYDDYNREHAWRFPNGTEVAASAAPDFLGLEDRVDPEEAFTAALASCHMLTFLAIAARKRHQVIRYRDAAVGTLAKNEDGKLAVTEVVLRPEIEFGGDKVPDAAAVEALHESAHRNCFIANSVKTTVRVEAPEAV